MKGLRRITYFENGKVTMRFKRLVRELLKKRAKVYRALAK